MVKGTIWPKELVAKGGPVESESKLRLSVQTERRKAHSRRARRPLASL